MFFWLAHQNRPLHPQKVLEMGNAALSWLTALPPVQCAANGDLCFPAPVTADSALQFPKWKWQSLSAPLNIPSKTPSHTISSGKPSSRKGCGRNGCNRAAAVMGMEALCRPVEEPRHCSALTLMLYYHVNSACYHGRYVQCHENWIEHIKNGEMSLTVPRYELKYLSFLSLPLSFWPDVA